jgi:hypothetical protein
VRERVFGTIADRGVTLDMMRIFPDRIAFTCESGSLPRVREAFDTLGVAYAVDPYPAEPSTCPWCILEVSPWSST